MDDATASIDPDLGGGSILCCKCGIPNLANMCVKCLGSEVQMTARDALNSAVDEEMLADPKVFLMGGLSMDDATTCIDPDLGGGSVLCCKCGIPNLANMCVKCLGSEVHIVEGLQVIYQCPHCELYLDPPGSGTWVFAKFRSQKLLALCLKRLNLNNHVTLVGAEFLRTGPQSKQIKVKVIVSIKSNGAVLEQIVEYDLHEQMCLGCSEYYKSADWKTKVKLRERGTGDRERVNYVDRVTRKGRGIVLVRGMDQGVDYFFNKHRKGSKFVSLIEEVAPVIVSKLVHGDANRELSNHFTFYVEIAPICRWDLICLPPELANSKNLGPLVICTSVTNNIDLLDPLTLRSCFLDGEQYFKWEFKPLLTKRWLVEYIVESVEEISSSSDQSDYSTSYTLADVQIARVTGDKKDSNVFKVRTHLGHMKVGDYAWGYDLKVYEAYLNREELDKHRGGLILPEAILVRKYDEKIRQKKLEMDELEMKEREEMHKEYLRDLKEEESTVEQEEEIQIIDEEEAKKRSAAFLRYLRSPPDGSPK